jgi:tetratricopeptide (TPR) repeat protein
MEQSSSQSRSRRQWSDSASATSDSSFISSLSTEPSETSLPLLLIDGPQRDDVVLFDNESFSPYEPSDWNENMPKPIPLKRTLHDLEEAIQQYGPNHVKVASLWSALGLIRHHMQHLTTAAVKCHRAAIDVYRQHDNCKVDLAVALTDLGRCYEYLHQSDKSVLLYREAAATLESDPTHQQSCFLQSVKRAQARLERR